MTQTKLTLELAFLNNSGQVKRLIILNPNPAVSPDQAQQTMDQIANSSLIPDYQTPHSARYITRQVDQLIPAPQAQQPYLTSPSPADPTTN